MTEAVARGRIIAPGFLTDPLIRQAYLQSEWIGPSQGQLDPTKEVAAAVTAIENGLSTREAEAIRLNGSEYAANVDKLTMENERLRKANGGAAQPAPAEPPQEDEPQEDAEPPAEDKTEEE
jgi:capsid protein